MAPVISVGESPVKQQFDFYILPNPAREQDRVSLSSFRLLHQFLLPFMTWPEIKSGEVINDQMLAAGSNRINMNTKDLHSGMYFCVITASGQQLAKKLIISK